MINRSFTLAILLLAAFWITPVSALPTFSDIVIIGDSLSDQGNVSNLTFGTIPPSEYTDGTNSGRFTNGLNYVDHLSSAIGLPVAPSSLGGSNYAYGGARTATASIGGNPIGPFSLLEQRDTYISSLDPTALHIVWGGSNDLTDIIEGTTDPAEIPLVLGRIGDILSSLALGGAKTILVPNVPNLGIVPLVTGGGAPNPLATALVAGFNDALAAVIDSLQATFLGTRFIEFDSFSLLTDVYINPGDYGLTNVSDSCYSLFVLPGGTTCANPEEYLSWDGFHPTSEAHRILAEAMAKAIPTPPILWLIFIGLVGIGYSQRQRSVYGATDIEQI